MAPTNRHEELASKWINGTITPEEKLEFSAWYNDHLDDHTLLPESFAEGEVELKVRILANVRKGRSKRGFRLRRMLTVAAALPLVATVGILLWQTQTNEPLRRPLAAQQGVQTVGNRAQLTPK